MKTMVMSAPGRETTTMAMVAALERQNPGEAFWVYRTRNHPVWSFYEILRAAAVVDAGGVGFDDVLFLEDDVVTALNFIRYARELPTRFVTSFFHVGRTDIDKPTSPRGFFFSQAMKFPARVVAQLVARAARVHGEGTDDEIGVALDALGEHVVYHRSVVQHVGTRSIAWGPEKTLEKRVADDFVGEDFDCLTLLSPTIGVPEGLLGTRAETVGAVSERESTRMGSNTPGGHRIDNVGELFGPMCRCGHRRFMHDANAVCCAVVVNDAVWVAPLGNSPPSVCSCKRFGFPGEPLRARGKTCAERNADLFYCTLEPGHEFADHIAHDADGVVRARWAR